MLRIIRPNETMNRTGDTHSPLYDKVAKGLFTRPIKVGQRAAGWPEHEVEAINAARVAGASADQIRQLVAKLHEQRTARMPALS